MHGERATRLGRALVVAAVAAATALAAWASGITERAELATIDARFAVRGTQAPSPDVVFVAIDEATLQGYPSFPFARSEHAAVIDQLAAAGARAIAYDVEFAAPRSRAGDEALLDAASGAGNVVFASTQVEDGLPVIFLTPASTREEGLKTGLATFDTDVNRGAIRRVSDLQGVAHFATQTVRAAGASVPRVARQEPGAWIDFRGPPGHVRRLSFARVRQGTFRREDVRGRIAVVGASATVLRDESPTSVAGVMDGAEIQANAIDTLLRDAPLRDARWPLIAMLFLLASAPAPLAAAAVGPRRTVTVTLAAGVTAGVLVVGAAVVAFAAGAIVPVTALAIAVVVSTVGAVAVSYSTEVRRRNAQRRAFARFVPEPVLDDVLDAAGTETQIAGELLVGTVLFCDLRGFTAIAEREPPAAVFTLLNTYLSTVSDAVLDEGGTIVAYLGDGVMAVFGAPVAQPDHADRALAAGRRILAAVPAAVQYPGGQSPALGIGIHSGSVISGTIGSQRRMEYATVGDVTNVAARLQEATKGTPHQALISDATRQALSAPSAAPDLVRVEPMTLRGRETATECWTFAPQA